MQAAVNGVRSSGATSQLILVEGTSWTGAWSMFTRSYVEMIWLTNVRIAWITSGNGDAFKSIKDPNNNLAIRKLSSPCPISKLRNNPT